MKGNRFLFIIPHSLFGLPTGGDRLAARRLAFSSGQFARLHHLLEAAQVFCDLLFGRLAEELSDPRAERAARRIVFEDDTDFRAAPAPLAVLAFRHSSGLADFAASSAV